MIDRCVAAVAGLVGEPRTHDTQARSDAEQLEVAVGRRQRGISASIREPLLPYLPT
jgi:hypothetical protein